MTRVLLVDDQDLVRGGFRVILETEPGIEVVGEARTGAEAVSAAAELRPDMICMDVQMPVMDGLEATRLIVAADGPPVLVLTTFDRDDYLFEALQAGASGFLLKNASPEKLVEAVQVVASGDALLAPDVTRRVIERFGSIPAPASDCPVLENLTEREHEVLGLLAKGRSNSEIAGELFLGEATVKTHVSNVLVKLGLRDRIHAVVFAYENGVVIPGA
ncbi:MAG: response regulator transcription factor [Microbacteriaceae bacterium]